MADRSGLVTVGGKPVTLVGQELKVGDVAPDVTVLGNEMDEVRLSSYRGKVCVISAVGSLDTPTCDVETRRFNAEAGKLGDDVIILTVSMDLPFAQKRWCGAASIDKVVTLSDHRDAAFGTAYGILVKESRLLARTIFVVDREGIVRYVQLVKELADEPDYDAVIAAVQRVV
jgi:thiol peroxidase